MILIYTSEWELIIFDVLGYISTITSINNRLTVSSEWPRKDEYSRETCMTNRAQVIWNLNIEPLLRILQSRIWSRLALNRRLKGKMTNFVLNPYDQDLNLSAKTHLKLYQDGSAGLSEKDKFDGKRRITRIGSSWWERKWKDSG